MTMVYTQKEADYLKDRQAGLVVDLHLCSDGVMRTAYEKSKFEQRVEWTSLGWRLRPESDGDVGSPGTTND